MLPLMISRFSKDKNTYENFQKFGTLLGISFQIKDDLLGYTSSSEVLGKTKNKDEIRNQPNFVNILGVEETKNILKENKESMRKILINNNFKNSYLSDITNYIFERKF